MRIAYLADVHDRFAVVPELLRETGAVDLLLIGGDITTGGTPDDVQRAIEGWRAHAPRLLAVAGNMDSAAIDGRLDALGVALDRRGIIVDRVGIFGLSAAPVTGLGTPYELDEAELARRIETAFKQVAESSLRIFCPHAPPRGTACDRLADGRHIGSEAVRAFVAREQPDLVLCGHIHQSRGADMLGCSRIVNPGPASEGHYALVETEPELVVWLDGETSPVEF
jgi:Icc-related predicted phosphoesterase